MVPRVLGLALVPFLVTLAWAEGKAVTPRTINKPSRVEYPTTPKRPGYILEISAANGDGGDFPSDNFRLRIITKKDGKNVVVEKKFTSSYGEFQLQVVDLTGDGIEEFILIAGEGRGTSARSERMHILKLSGDSFNTILDTEVSDYYGPGHRWWYLIDYYEEKGTVVLRLKRQSDPIDECNLCYTDLIPREKIVKYKHNASKGIMVRDL